MVMAAIKTRIRRRNLTVRRLLSALVVVLCSCSDYLDLVPDNVATIDYAFRNATEAEKYWATCYSYLPNIGHPGYDPAILGSDELWIHDVNTWYTGLANFWPWYLQQGQQNVTEPLLNFWDSGRDGSNLFIGLRDCNIFLENIGKVGKDLSEADRNTWIAEVKALKAFYHFWLLRMYGPIPLVRENLPISSAIDDVRVYREPFDDCVNYIAELIDEAVPDLMPEVIMPTTQLGRITQPAALAIKADLLLMAASPLFNGNPVYKDIADSRGIKLFPQTREVSKWQRAMTACKNAIDTALLANVKLYEFVDARYPVHDSTRLVMSLRNAFGQRWNTEVIWGISKNSAANLQAYSLPWFSATDQALAATQPVISPTMKVAEMFYSRNGVPIDEDPSYPYESRYTVTAASPDQMYYVASGFETANLNQFREARFYATLGFDGGIWFGNGRTKEVGEGDASTQAWTVNAKSGQMSGKVMSIRFSATGYFAKKYSHFESVTNTSAFVPYRMAFPYYRLADLYLMYAEARNEYSGPDSEVYKYIDLVRERAGLAGVLDSWRQYSRYPDKPASQDGLREIIRRERNIELALEGKRFWDIRRWTTADTELNQPVKGWNVDGKTAPEYYQPVTLYQLEFTTKEYLWPLKQNSIRRNPSLVQNPFWEN